MASNISVVGNKHCCGCRACGDICSYNAITYVKDEDGFVQPHIDNNKCVNCGKCLRICPIAHHHEGNVVPEICYASVAVNKSDWQAGSSGGVFGLLARTSIKEGYTVFGAAFHENLQLLHQEARSENELLPLLKSKYLQSNTEGIYRRIMTLIQNGGKVLFCGTPCQCNAVRNYVGESENILLVDFVCHGVPSQDLFDKTIKWYEKKNHVVVESFQFRYKGKGIVRHPRAFNMMVRPISGRTIRVSALYYNFPFYFAFQKHISFRESCYECKWAAPTRCSDVTLADFWGIEKYDSSYNSDKGVSMIAFHTAKGENWFNKLVTSGQIINRKVPYRFAVDNNTCLHKPTPRPQNRDLYFHALKNEPFDKVVKEFMTARRGRLFDVLYRILLPLRSFWGLFKEKIRFVS